MVKISQLTGAINQSWSRLQRISDQVNRPKIHRAVEDVREKFFENGELAYAAMADAARAGAVPPMEFLAWRAWTVDMLANLLAARDPPIQQVVSDIEDVRGSLTRDLIVGLTALGLLVAVVLWAGIVVERGLIKPIVEITAAIEKTRESSDLTAPAGDCVEATKSLPELEERGDEIGSLARALGTLNAHTQEIEKFASAHRRIAFQYSAGLVPVRLERKAAGGERADFRALQFRQG